MRIAILGCGYVGCSLAERLVESDHTVYGIRRSSDRRGAIEATGAEAVVADMTDPASLAAIPSVDGVVIAVSTGGADAATTRSVLVDGLTDAIRTFASRPNPPERVVYTSTTGVYGNHDDEWVDETTDLAPGSSKTAVFAEAELVCRSVANQHDIDPVVARLGGVYGPDRYRISSTLSRPIYPGYRNLIHRDDAGGALAQFVTEGAGDHDTVLVVDNEPVRRTEFVHWIAAEVGQSPPEQADPASLLDDPDRSPASIRRLRESKRCDNSRLRRLGYELDYPTFREGYATAVREYRSS